MIWAFAFNILINSLLSFFTSALVVLLFIGIFRIKDYRLRAFLYCLPVFKLFVDPFLYDFQHWALIQHINPFYAEAGSRAFSAMIYYPSTLTKYIPIGAGIQLSINNTQTFSIADLLYLSMGSKTTKAIIGLVFAVSATGVAVWGYRLAKSLRYMAVLRQSSTPCLRAVFNQSLVRRLLRSHASIRVSHVVDVPCAVGLIKKEIYFPSHLVEALSQEEFEAIIAHETAHLRWKDGIVQAFSKLIYTVFWWVPMGKLIQAIEYNHECACDDHVEKYGISRLDLASAIVKTAKGTTAPAIPVTCFVKSSSLKRLQHLVRPRKKAHYAIHWVQASLESIVIMAVLFGKLWIF